MLKKLSEEFHEGTIQTLISIETIALNISVSVSKGSSDKFIII